MTDAAYLIAFGDGLDAFFRYIGDDEAYRATGNTFFTAETHVNYYREMKLGETFSIETQVLGCDEKRMHLFHRMYHGKTKELVATNEIMQLHVNQKAGKVVPMRSDLYEALSAIGKAHKKLKKPKEMGSVMQVKRK
jgi:carnitine 3-dehydrogenase